MRSLDVEEFNQALSDASGLVVVDFWAPWCGPCCVVTPILESIEAEYEDVDTIDFYQVNVEEVPDLMDAFKLRSIPSVLLLKPNDGGGARVLDALIGAQSAHTYIKWIERYLNPKPSLITRVLSVFGSPKK